MIRKDNDQYLAALQTLDASGLAVGQRWVHYRGGRYLIVAIGLYEASLEPMVIYTSITPETKITTWVRSLSDFLVQVNWDGKMVARFARVSDE